MSNKTSNKSRRISVTTFNIKIYLYHVHVKSLQFAGSKDIYCRINSGCVGMSISRHLEIPILIFSLVSEYHVVCQLLALYVREPHNLCPLE